MSSPGYLPHCLTCASIQDGLHEDGPSQDAAAECKECKESPTQPRYLTPSVAECKSSPTQSKDFHPFLKPLMFFDLATSKVTRRCNLISIVTPSQMRQLRHVIILFVPVGRHRCQCDGRPVAVEL